jgi:hypothetical protein
VALEYLDALERSHDVGRIAFRRTFEEWWAQAGREERLAMMDVMAGETESPTSWSRMAQYTARTALAAMHADCRELRERYVARRYVKPDDRA